MMTQQGSEGFLGESELPEQIHRYLDLKLDKDSFIKPTKDVVMELYGRFLDKTGYDWRRNRQPGHEPILMAQMLRALKIIFSRFNIDYDFNLSDLITPTRKRTTTFLNVILYLLAMLEEKLKLYQQWQTQDAAEQQEVELIKQEIAKKREALDRLYLKIGEMPKAEELRLENRDLERMFNERKKESNLMEQEKDAIKQEIEEEKRKAEELERRIRQAEQRQDLKIKVEKLAQDEQQLRDRVCHDKVVADQRLGQVDCEITQAEGDLRKIRYEMMEYTRDAKTRVDKLDMNLADIRKRREDMEVQYNQRRARVKGYIEKSNKLVETLRTNAAKDRELTEKKVRDLGLESINDELRNLLGEPKLAPLVEADKNSTFIKSSAPR